MSHSESLLEELEDARDAVATYDRRVWWMGFAVASSLVAVALAFVTAALTDWANIPAAFGMLGGFGLAGSLTGLCSYVFTVGTDNDSRYSGRTSPRTRLRKAERAYAAHVLANGGLS